MKLYYGTNIDLLKKIKGKAYYDFMLFPNKDIFYKLKLTIQPFR